ncbi:MAG: DUF2085 domain-containing protein, partial [Anaerolineales bacterium]|nr:DUF2085 domain-containing protein [Anaerolineales bacterium]
MTRESETTLQSFRHRRLASVIVFIITALVAGLWLYFTPDGLLGKADAIGYAVCHRIDLRSFHLGARPLPLCARCTGMFLGALIAFAYYALRRTKASFYPTRGVLAAVIVLGLTWVVDGANSFLSMFPSVIQFYTPHNTLRLITGSLVGIALVTLVYPVFSQYAWKDWKSERILRSPRDLLVLLSLVGVVDLAVLSENPLLLYPLALLSSIGVLLLLTLAYTLITIPILRRTQKACTWRDLIVPLAAGLTLGLLQIGLIDLLRYTLTGTWG